MSRTARQQSPVLQPLGFGLACATALCTLAAHAGHLPAWFSVALAAIIGARWWQRRRHRRRVPALLRIALLLALPVVVMLVFGTPLGREPGAAFICGLLVLKLLETETPRDARMLAGFACFILMSALLFNQSLGYTILVGVLLLPPLATLRAVEPGLPGNAWLRAFAPGAALLGLGLPVALLAFVLVPRLASPLWGAPDSDVARTGVSDRMAPGDFSTLLGDNSVAMRIGFEGPPPAANQRYFRGMVLWDFDGHAWSPGAAARRAAAPAPLGVRGPETSYDVTLLPSHQHWLFALDMPMHAPTGTSMGADHTLGVAKPIDQEFRYRLTSTLDYRLAPEGLSARLRSAALQLPAGFDPRARALAQQWQQHDHGDDAAIVNAALAMFHNGGFAYSLDAPPLGRDSVDDFLFHTKVGFCEHYAGAFTFLMRAAGVPARVVVGYQGGYWNELAHYLLLRQSDAHAWSEVWLRDRGWVRVDPTAAVSRELLAGDNGAAADRDGDIGGGVHSWWLPWQNRVDIINRWWGQTVVGFDALRQSTLLRPFGIAHTDLQALGIALAILLVVALGGGALLASLRPRARPRDALAGAQARLQRKLARVGMVRGANEGPADFYARSARALPRDAPRLRSLAAAYLPLRYAHAQPPADATREFLRAVQRFRPTRTQS